MRRKEPIEVITVNRPHMRRHARRHRRTRKDRIRLVQKSHLPYRLPLLNIPKGPDLLRGPQRYHQLAGHHHVQGIRLRSLLHQHRSLAKMREGTETCQRLTGQRRNPGEYAMCRKNFKSMGISTHSPWVTPPANSRNRKRSQPHPAASHNLRTTAACRTPLPVHCRPSQ